MQEISLQETLQNAIEHQLDGINTAIPGIVVRADLENSLVDVQPVINFKAYDGTTTERPVIQGVPLQYPASKTSAFTFPVQSGDTVLLVFSQRGLDVWKRGTGYPTTPSDFRTFDIKDAIAIPGIMPNSMSVNNPSKHVFSHSTRDAVIAHNLGGGSEVEVRLGADGRIEISTSNKPAIINCSDATINAENINLNANTMTVDIPNITFIGNITHHGDYAHVGTYTLNSVNINLHRHTGVVTGAGTSGTMV